MKGSQYLFSSELREVSSNSLLYIYNINVPSNNFYVLANTLKNAPNVRHLLNSVKKQSIITNVLVHQIELN